MVKLNNVFTVLVITHIPHPETGGEQFEAGVYKPEGGHPNTNDYQQPQQNEGVLVQHVLRYLANNFVSVGV